MFGKWFASTYTGSMLGAGSDVFAVWSWVIANAGPDGLLEINPPLLAALIGEPVERIEKAIDYLAQPDERSRSDAEDGRRIVHVEAFLYSVVNHDKYRAMRDEERRRVQNREAQRRKRERDKGDDSQQASADVSNVSRGQPKTEGRGQKKKAEGREERESPAKPSTREIIQLPTSEDDERIVDDIVASKRKKKRPKAPIAKPEYSEEVIEIAQYLYDAIREHSPGRFSEKPKKVEALLLGWCKAIDLGMREGTKASKDEKGFNGPDMTLSGAKAVIDVAHRGKDDFWHKNMISGSSLRNSYARLVIEARKAYSARSAVDDFDYVAAAERHDRVLGRQ